jgi:hypothetical protein
VPKTTGLTFDDVANIGLQLPDTAEASAWGGRSLKVNGRHFCGTAIHKSAEPNSLIIHVETAQRDLMIEEQPDLYYTAPHYENYPCVLVRLSRVRRDILEDLLRMSHKFVSAKSSKSRRRTKRTPATRGARTPSSTRRQPTGRRKRQ